MSFELLFDGFESGASIQGEIDKLQQLSDIDPGLKRPPKVKVVWGAEGAPGTIPKFEAVVESMGIRYTMFDGNGRPLRATVRMGFKQARKIKVVLPVRQDQAWRRGAAASRRTSVRLQPSRSFRAR